MDNIWSNNKDLNELHFNLMNQCIESDVFEIGDKMIVRTYKSETLLLYSPKFDSRYALGHIEKYVTINKETSDIMSTSYAYVIYGLNRTIISFKEELADYILYKVTDNIPEFDTYRYIKNNYDKFLAEIQSFDINKLLNISKYDTYDNEHIENLKIMVEALYKFHNFNADKDMVIEYLNYLKGE